MSFREKISASPALLRVAPFVLFVLITAGQGELGPESTYWLYLVKTVLGAAMIFALRSFIAEMRWAFSWEAVAVGIGVFIVWVGINGEWSVQTTLWHKLGLASAPKELALPWNPIAQFGDGSALAWLFIAVRILGSTLVVPPLEEVFYRSFLYRYLASQNFMVVPLNRFALMPFVVTALVFGLAHNEWLAGILCAAGYQWLVLRKNRLGDAMTAHAITNFLLGVWVVWRGVWNLW